MLIAGIGSPAMSQPLGNWADVEGRIQYAYYTEDARALDGVLNSLKPKPVEGGETTVEEGSRDPLVLPCAGPLPPRPGAEQRQEVAGQVGNRRLRRRSRAGPSRHCPRCHWVWMKRPPRATSAPKAYALGTACTLAGHEMSVFGGRLGSRIDEAVKLEPKNPRVRLVEALAAFDRAGKDAAEKNAAVQKLRAVTPMFEAARAGESTTPEWGAAEAYAFLGTGAVRPARRGRRARGAGARTAARARLCVRAATHESDHALAATLRA
jgi:hypothetical protein